MIYKKKFPHVSKFRIKKLNKKRISEKKNQQLFSGMFVLHILIRRKYNNPEHAMH